MRPISRPWRSRQLKSRKEALKRREASERERLQEESAPARMSSSEGAARRGTAAERAEQERTSRLVCAATDRADTPLNRRTKAMRQILIVCCKTRYEDDHAQSPRRLELWEGLTAFALPLQHHLPFKLREAGEDGEDRLSCRALRVDRLAAEVEHAKACPSILDSLKPLHDLPEADRRAGQPVDLGDDKRVPAAHVLKGAF